MAHKAKLEKEGPGIRIFKSGADVIKVVEGGGASRFIGAAILLGGTLLAWNGFGRIMDMTFLSGVVLMLFGAAIATQRYVLTLNRLHGAWSCGGDVFFIISFKSRGSLTTLGPVRIGTLATNPRDHHIGEPIITYPVSIEARTTDGTQQELRFGKHWSLDEARNIAETLADFLNKPVLDETDKEP
jgi:hypothetical protein